MPQLAPNGLLVIEPPPVPVVPSESVYVLGAAKDAVAERGADICKVQVAAVPAEAQSPPHPLAPYPAMLVSEAACAPAATVCVTPQATFIPSIFA